MKDFIELILKKLLDMKVLLSKPYERSFKKYRIEEIEYEQIILININIYLGLTENELLLMAWNSYEFCRGSVGRQFCRGSLGL